MRISGGGRCDSIPFWCNRPCLDEKRHIGDHKCNLTRSELFSYDKRSECVQSATWHPTEEEEEEEGGVAEIICIFLLS